MIYRFVRKPPSAPPEQQGWAYTIHQKLKAGEKLTEDETYYLMGHTIGGSVPKGCIACGGWCFDLRSFLNLYWVKWYDDIIPVYAPVYAPNKKAIRQHVGGRIGRIVLVEKKGVRAHN